MTTMVRYISTRDPAGPTFSFTEAMQQGLAPLGGLFVPDHIPPLPAESLAPVTQPGEAARLLAELIPEWSLTDLTDTLTESLNFPVPLIHLRDNLFLLEVFHGPTLAFKDVGARFMARILAKALPPDTTMDILVATSGDTGSAVAQGFLGLPGIRVHVLYPAGRVTPLQEKQMATLGQNIFPLKVAGSFDDCQRLVKAALDDPSLAEEAGCRFSTANSINIARLLPQMIYHTAGLQQLKQHNITLAPLLSIPSGNLGNLVSALYAHRRGMPVAHFIAATNRNTALPDFLATGRYLPRNSIPTFSSAMDVGHPSNMERLQHLFGHDKEKMRSHLTAIPVNDEETLETIRLLYHEHGYLADPHTAVGVAAALRFCAQQTAYRRHPVIVTATAHPAKFPDVMREALGTTIDLSMPPALEAVMHQPVNSRPLTTDYALFRTQLIHDAR